MEEQMSRTGAPIAALALAALMATSVVQAQEWPTRPVTMVVPFAAGGPVDVLGRILAQYLGETIGKQVIVDNVPGGGGMTGSLRVSQAAPDGYMFVLASIGTHALNQTLSKKPLYNAATDFAPVALIADVGLVLITRKDLPPNNLAEFITYAKAKPGQDAVRLGGAGTSSHIGCVAAQPDHRRRHHPRPLSRRGPGNGDLFAAGSIMSATSLRPSAKAVAGKQANAIGGAHARAIADPARSAHRARTGPHRLRRLYLERRIPAQGHAAGAGEKAQPGAGDGDGKSRLPGAPHALGLIVVAPERQTPAYLQTFVESEIDKWAVPIKASGVKED
jgi:hypothetical protein